MIIWLIILSVSLIISGIYIFLLNEKINDLSELIDDNKRHIGIINTTTIPSVITQIMLYIKETSSVINKNMNATITKQVGIVVQSNKETVDSMKNISSDSNSTIHKLDANINTNLHELQKYIPALKKLPELETKLNSVIGQINSISSKVINRPPDSFDVKSY